MKTFSFGIKYRVGSGFIHSTARIVKNKTIPPTRAIKAAAARAAARSASRQSHRSTGTTGNISVSGAGTTAVNGVYIQTSTLNGQPFYTQASDSSFVLGFDGAKWVIAGGAFTEYNGTASITGAYSTSGGIGLAPAPAVAFASAGAGFYIRAVDVTDPMLASQRRLLSVRNGLYAFCASNP